MVSAATHATSVVKLVVGIAVGILAGCLTALAGALVGAIFSWGDLSQDWPPIVVIGFLVGFVATLGFTMKWIARPYQDAAQGRRRAETMRAEAARKAETEAADRRAEVSRALLRNSGEAMRAFESMPEYIQKVKHHTADAIRTYRDGAYSPFWSSIEGAYAGLADYRAAATAVREAANRHGELVNSLKGMRVDVSTVAVFPVSLDMDRVASTANDATANLADIVYEAQRQPVFAQIWEQRRTTAAVIQGFANLEVAVNGMRSAIGSALTGLASSLAESHRSTESTLRHMSASMHQVSSEHAHLMRELNATAIKVKDELYHQTWGHYPLFD